MADEKVIMDIAFGRVDASAITKTLTGEFTKLFSTTKSATASLGAGWGEKSGGGGKGGGDILVILQMIFGTLINNLGKIVQTVVTLFPVIMFISLIIKILADTVSAFWGAFRNVTRVWDGIFQLISKIVEPFVNLLIPILIPVLQLLGIMARIVNAVMMPIFALLMKAFSPKGDTMQAAFKQIMGGDLFGGLLTILKGVTESFLGLKDKIMSQVMVAFDLVKSWLLSFLTIDLSVIHEIINNLFGKDLGGVINLLIDTIYNTISALIGFVAQIAGKANFDKLFGEGKFDEIKSKNEGFGAGADVAKAMQDFITAIIDLVSSTWPLLVGVIKQVIDEIPKLVFAINLFISSTWQNLKEDMDSFHTTLWPLLSSALTLLANTINKWATFNFVEEVKNAIHNMMPHGDDARAHTAADLGGGGYQDDFVMRPGQGAVSFSPNDTLIGVKDPSALSGGRGNITVNIYGNGDKYLEDKVKEVVQGSESRLSRYGYYQKGR